jgi:hypothetical protein
VSTLGTHKVCPYIFRERSFAFAQDGKTNNHPEAAAEGSLIPLAPSTERSFAFAQDGKTNNHPEAAAEGSLSVTPFKYERSFAFAQDGKPGEILRIRSGWDTGGEPSHSRRMGNGAEKAHEEGVEGRGSDCKRVLCHPIP